MDQLEKLASSGNDALGGLQHKQRLINILNKQIEQKQADLNEKKTEIQKINQNLEALNQDFSNVYSYEIKLELLTFFRILNFISWNE